MTKFLTAAMIATVALGGAAIASENPSQESRAKLEQLWGKKTAPSETGQVSVTRGDDQRSLRSTTTNNRIKGEGSVFDRLRSVQPSPAGR